MWQHLRHLIFFHILFLLVHRRRSHAGFSHLKHSVSRSRGDRWANTLKKCSEIQDSQLLGHPLPSHRQCYNAREVRLCWQALHKIKPWTLSMQRYKDLHDTFSAPRNCNIGTRAWYPLAAGFGDMKFTGSSLCSATAQKKSKHLTEVMGPSSH